MKPRFHTGLMRRLGAPKPGSEAGVALSDNGQWQATTPATHQHAAADITSGVLSPARLGTGTADGTTYLRGDGVWDTP